MNDLISSTSDSPVLSRRRNMQPHADIDLCQALLDLKQNIDKAASDFRAWVNGGDEYDDPAWRIEVCFLQLLAISELLGLSEFRGMTSSEYNHYRTSRSGFNSSKMGPDEPYSVCLSRIRTYFYTLESFFPQDRSTTISKDLLGVLRDIQYVITDNSLFGSAPQNERDVHIRIEGILKCLFVDLKHKPQLTKPIKNFEPDTGILSMETLIEYKFLSKQDDVPIVADEILADTRGYVSNDWSRFVYVIYETNRFRPEKEWKQFLHQSGLTENTEVVVLCGEPPVKRRRKKAPARRASKLRIAKT